MIVLDTNAVSALMHRIPEALSRLRMSEPADAVLCGPVAAEIHYGLSRLARGSRRRAVLAEEYTRLREAVAWVDWTEAAASVLPRAHRRRRLGPRVAGRDPPAGGRVRSPHGAAHPGG